MPPKKTSLKVEKKPKSSGQEPQKKKLTPKRPQGRPDKYPTHVEGRLEEVEEWAKAGASREEIASNLRVSRASLLNYQNRHPEFAEALSRGDQVAVAQVEAALFRSAVGYRLDFEEVIEEEVFHQGLLAGVKKRVKRGTKHVAPNERAARMILTNKAPQTWSDKTQVEHSGEIGQPGAIVVPAVAATLEDWEQMVKAQSKPKLPKPQTEADA
ncbi:MAG: hypothetical protein RRB13_02725 [bacterium]|nr:hypothetical protein [bacterium]